VKAVTTSPYFTYRVEAGVTGPTTGQISHNMRYKRNPVGGVTAMTVVQATCVDGKLLTGTNGPGVLTVGVARKPSERRPGIPK
jgi:hypothetical protein